MLSGTRVFPYCLSLGRTRARRTMRYTFLDHFGHLNREREDRRTAKPPQNANRSRMFEDRWTLCSIALAFCGGLAVQTRFVLSGQMGTHTTQKKGQINVTTKARGQDSSPVRAPLLQRPAPRPA